MWFLNFLFFIVEVTSYKMNEYELSTIHLKWFNNYLFN